MGSQWRGAGREPTGWGDSRRYGEDRGERRRTGGRLRALYERMSESGFAGFIGFSGWRLSCWGCWVDRGVGREFMRVYERIREIGGKIGVGAGLSGLVRVGWCVFGVKVDGWGGLAAILGGEGGCGGVLGRGMAVGWWVMGRGIRPLLMGRRLFVIFYLF